MEKEEFKQIAQEIKVAIDGAEDILLHLHPSPDGDSVGSGLAMMYALQAMGKKATLIKGDSNPPQSLSHLPGFEKIVKKNYFETDLSEFDLFIIQDAGGLNQISKKAGVVLPEGLATVVIDHHASNTGFADINLVAPEYPATCQILFDLFREWGVEMTEDTASCLILGIYTDTGGFKYPYTRPETFEVAGELARYAPDFSKIIFDFENNNKPGRIKFLGLALSNIKEYFGGKVAVSAVSQKDLGSAGINPDDTQKANIGSYLKSVVGWDVGISMIESEANFVRISIRTRDEKKYDVSKLASALGGGGHVAAAGAEIKKPMAEALADVLSAIEKTFPDLKQI